MINHGRWPHTSIFYGPSGVGKFLSAKAVAQNFICTTQRACGQCGPCVRVDLESSESLLLIQPEKLEIKVDQARSVVRFMDLKNLGAARVVIIDQAHRLNRTAANILLKTLEEPPENSYLILVTPTLSGVLPTIRSRAQVMRFAMLGPEDLGKLMEGSVPPWILNLGRVGLAKEFLEQGAAMTAWTYELWSALLGGDVGTAFGKLKDRVKDRGASLRVVWFWQQLMKAAWAFKVGRPVPPWQGEVLEGLACLGESQLSEISLKTVGLERDIMAQLERSLCFENYFYEVDDLIQGRLYG